MSRAQPTLVPIGLGMVKAFLIRGERSAILVDTGFRGSAGRILRAAARAGVEPESIALILLTHGHSDHFGSAAALRERTGAPVAVHPLDAPAVRRGSNPPLRGMTALGRLLLPVARAGEPPAQGLEPDLLVDGELDLAQFGVPGRVLHTPGHTPGSITILLDGGEAIVGDLLMGALLVTRRPDYPFVGDDRERLERSVRELLQLQPRRMHTAHGGPLAAADVGRVFGRV